MVDKIECIPLAIGSWQNRQTLELKNIEDFEEFVKIWKQNKPIESFVLMSTTYTLILQDIKTGFRITYSLSEGGKYN